MLDQLFPKLRLGLIASTLGISAAQVAWAQSGIDGVHLEYTTTGGTIVTDALGRQVTYELTPGGANALPRKIIEVADGNGGKEYTYFDSDSRRRLQSSKDRRGVVTTYSYDELNDAIAGLVSVKTTTEAVGTPDQRVSEVRALLDSNRIVQQTVGNTEIRIARNSRLQPLSVTIKDIATGDTKVTLYTYCEAEGPDCPRIGLLRSVDGPRTDVVDSVTYAWHAADDTGCATGGSCSFRKGDLRSVTNALGHTIETLAYDAFGRPLSIRDANGVVTDYTYHARGWITAIAIRGATSSDDRITKLSYWPTGQLQQVIEPGGSWVFYIYDSAQRLTDINDSANNTIHYVLDAAGNRLQEDAVDAGGGLRRTLSRIYNTLGQLVTLKDASGHATNFTYDLNGSPISVTDALQRVSTQQYDALGRLTQSLHDVSGIAANTQYKYDALENITEVTDPKGLKTAYTYDGLSQPETTSSPDTSITHRTFDEAGNLKTSTDARGITATYSYDSLNRAKSVSYPTQGEDIAYTYDVAPISCAAGERFGAGRLSSIHDGSGSTEYCYNRFGNTLRKVQVTNGRTFVVRYTYTAGGNLASVIYPDGGVADYVRDAQGRITEVGVTSGSSGRQVLLTAAGYLPFGPSTGWQYGNGRALVRSFDLDYRPIAVVDSDHDLKIGLSYDAVSNITALESGDYAAGLTYDALGRLTEFRDSNANVTIDQYSYDATGNRLSVANAGGTVPYTYETASHRLSSVGAIGRSYDAVGNTVAAGNGAKELVYNQASRLSQVKLGGVLAQRYAYNAGGERVQRGLDTGTSVYSTYDEAGRWLGDYDALGNVAQQVIWMDDLPVGLLAGGVLHYIEPDHLGTPRVVFNPMRNVPVWTWDIKGEAFGNDLPDQDPDGDGQAFVFDMRFPGQRYDAVSGLNYNYFRDYDSSAGRYVQSDPIGLGGGVSTYAYVGGRPMGAVDPLGLLQWELLPTQWKSGYAAGAATYTYPGAPQSEFRANTLARTTIDWNISAQCSCGDSGYSLNEYSVSLLPLVLMRSRYDSPEIRRSTRRDELDHVRDLNNWANSAKVPAEQFESGMKSNVFGTASECESAAISAMQGHLSSSVLPAIVDSHRRWDASGKHRLIVPGR